MAPKFYKHLPTLDPQGSQHACLWGVFAGVWNCRDPADLLELTLYLLPLGPRCSAGQVESCFLLPSLPILSHPLCFESLLLVLAQKWYKTSM